MARRSSYASVLAGSASGGGPARSGFMSTSGGRETGGMSHTRSPSMPQPQTRTSQSYTGPNRSTDPFDNDDLPPYSSSLGVSTMESRTPMFYVPSYLQDSRHVERLEEKHKAKLKAIKDGTGRHSNGGSLSRSGSGISLHKIVPSHRGMTYDIQEKFPGYGEEVLAPLPTRWSVLDKQQGLEISQDGFDVTLTQAKSTNVDEAAALRADHPAPQACGIYYYEVTVCTKGKEAPIGIGFSGSKAALSRLPGWEAESWAYHGDDGFSFNSTSSGKQFGPKFGYADVVGCGIDFATRNIFFTRNGHNLGVAFKDVRCDKLYPSVGMKKPGEKIRANFGLTPFVFDIDGMVYRQKAKLHKEISAEPIIQLGPPKLEPWLLQELVGQYLAHEGYTETTKAFHQEAREVEGFVYGSSPNPPPEYKEDLDAINRQRIRSEILRGDIDAALKHTKAYYPSVLQDNEYTTFKLKCRKFIEMIKRSADLAGPPRSKRPSSTSISRTRPSRSSTNGHHEPYRDEAPNVFSATGDMDIDTEQALPETAADDANMADTKDVSSRRKELEDEAILYGRELQREYKDDPRREVEEALKETFALIAYPDARESSLAHLLEEEGRVPVAEELNGAILVSLGQSSNAALERLVQQTDVLCQEISMEGGGAALLNLTKDYMR